MLFEPVKIADFRGGSRHDQEAILSETRDRQIRLDSSLFVQPLRIDDTTGPNVNVIGAYVVQHPCGISSFKPVLGEGRLVEQADIFTHRPVFGGRVLEPVLASVAVFIAGFHPPGRIPVGPFPPSRFSVTGAY